MLSFKKWNEICKIFKKLTNPIKLLQIVKYILVKSLWQWIKQLLIKASYLRLAHK